MAFDLDDEENEATRIANGASKKKGGHMEDIKRCISKKDYLEEVEDSIVGYALYVLDKIKKNDYVRLITGDIIKVIGIRENKVNKKAIYYSTYEQDWLDCHRYTSKSACERRKRRDVCKRL